MPAIHPGDCARPATDAPRRSPLLARVVLLGACVAGLTGLAVVPSQAPAVDTLVAASTSSSVISAAEPAALHGIVAPRPVQRATRTRTAPAKKAVTRTASRKKAAVRTARWVRPSGAGVISSYGERWGRLHKGVDFGDSYGSPIRAIGDGVVVGVGYQGGESGYGKITIIRHSNGMYSAYAHQSSYSVSVGERVEAGEVIGRVGTTGNVTGAHLHFEIRRYAHGGQVNPRTWMREHGVYL